MITFLETLAQRDLALYYFGWVCLLLTAAFIVLSYTSSLRVNGVNAWHKPIKFGLSIFIYAWTMAWLVHYLPGFNATAYNVTSIVLLGFELFYIGLQAARGQMSHYNASTKFYKIMFALMGLAASVATLYTAYIGVLFFLDDFPTLPLYYLWSIRLGIMLFVVFAFEGAMMGSRMSHTIGAPDDHGKGLPFLNWSKKFGDARVAHFIGMHALQVLPLLSFYVLKNVTLTILVGLLYGLLATFTLVQALKGKPLVRARKGREAIPAGSF
ncbi:hypothetical protein [Mucilaginibacter sp. HD30]